ncbi:hypothetical protein NEISICOT_00425 [Neisseria sicca ATCC 29256]|uniref:Uncharacterized protein n=1 Tax=Neisseria sicca ATCC 29256 TaxID=547045 RepID=C6M1P0_NEISI|nr:hypothetical protein NEISICOT_00425 [Neisseria sicca ATCC 29256]
MWFEPINCLFEKMWIILNITFSKKPKRSSESPYSWFSDDLLI